MPLTDERKRAYQRAWKARRRAEWLDGKACVDCGATESLEVDHVDPEQKVSHNVWSWAAERREAELAKCVVRCKDCHFIRSQEQRGGPSRHGSKRRYDVHGCRCVPCRDGNALRRRTRRQGTTSVTMWS